MAKRIHITIRGAVQGVGFRPFVYRWATTLNLRGWVINDPDGVTIDAEGSENALNQLLDALHHKKPTHSYYEDFDYEYLEPEGYRQFRIRESNHQGSKRVLVLPDIATCQDCIEETFDPENRRYLYPFTNCTHCGPRYSIITDLPYDRHHTTMDAFTMCKACRAEYEDPTNRRFHAQPNACPRCGPHMELWDVTGRTLCRRNQAIKLGADAIKRGKVVALKGIGGFQLLADACNESAIDRLRTRKERAEKPFALMVPSLNHAREVCKVSAGEEQWLDSPQAPIVILNQKEETDIPLASSIAPGHPTLGIMLPYTPLHHILMNYIDRPVVATSGNLSDEPICTDEYEALNRLQGIADLYLVHNRPIERHVDDSVVRMIAGEPTILRRARGYAPLPVSVNIDPVNNSQKDTTDKPSYLAVGGHLKNCIAVNRGSNIFVSQHIGDLDTLEATKAYQKVTRDLSRLYDLTPTAIIHDKHPDYHSSKDAHKRNLPTQTIQHHHAHILSGMAEHGLEESVLGVAWDGTGYGTDETIWGGEFILTNRSSWNRIATFRNFRLPGGDTAMREPRRSSLGMLYEIFGNQAFNKSNLFTLQAFSEDELGIIKKMLHRNLNAPITSSVGRIYDAVASLLNLYQTISYEGQAAMALEHLLPEDKIDKTYPYTIKSGAQYWIIDWEPMIQNILMDINFTHPSFISNKFQNTLSEIIIEIAHQTGLKNVLLSGGCFQNVYLTELTISKLMQEGFHPYWHQQVPPNDGGLAVGQLFYALCNSKETMNSTNHYEVSG